jgi:hypothetical protein
MSSTRASGAAVLALLVLGSGTMIASSPSLGDAAPSPRVADAQLVPDPGFEDAAVRPCVRPASKGSVVSRDGRRPLRGRFSVDARMDPRSAVACSYRFQSQPLLVSAEASAVVANLSDQRGHGVAVCLQVALVTGTRRACQSVAPGARKVVDVAMSTSGVRASGLSLKITAGRGAHVRLDEAELHATAEAASSCSLAHERAPVGPPEPWSGCNDNDTTVSTSYVPASLRLPRHRPFISLRDYTAAPASDPVAVLFKQYVDRAMAGNPDYGYSPADAVILFARTGREKYLASAIDDVNAQVVQGERAIQHGDAPAIAGDSYLEVGPLMEDLALTYDWGYHELTKTQRARWRTYADQAVGNVWSPRTATWGNARAGKFPWSGWSINDPGNNYNYSFIQATQLWALASRQRPWMSFLQHSKFPAISDYYTELAGGGSREGTGYGTAQRRLWANARTWAEGTGEHLTAVEDHARASVDYWGLARAPSANCRQRGVLAASRGRGSSAGHSES